MRAARERGPDVRIEHVARNFGIHHTTLTSWLRAAEVDDGPPIPSPDVLRENRDLKRHLRLLEQENEALRRLATYLAQFSCREMALPPGQRVSGCLCPSGGADDGLALGTQVPPIALLRLAGLAGFRG
jgi:transposase-like protein